MWSAKGGHDGRGGYVETVWPGIAELRTTAARTGNYAGCDEAEFGPTIEKVFKGKIKVGKGQNAEWQTKEITLKFPEWCRMTVYRVLAGHTRKFVGPKVIWLEAYATIGKSELPNEMWESRPEGQIEKCAEAAALRRAFPEETGNELTVDEMAGRTIDDSAEPVEHVQHSAGPPPPSAVKSGAAPAEPAKSAQPDVIDVEAEEVEAIPADDENPAPQQQTTATQTQPTTITADERDWLNELSGAFSGCEDLGTFADKQKSMMAGKREKTTKEAWARAQHLAEDAYKRISANG
jgi:phage recombination protein Bet